MKQLAIDELLAEMVVPGPRDRVERQQAELLQKLRAVLERRPGAEAVVLFKNVDMSSSRLGAGQAVAVGEDCGIPSVEYCEDKHLGDLPSERMYPQGFVPAAEVKGGN